MMPEPAAPITIRSADSAATARIRPDLGFNCFSFEAPVGERLVEALWAEPEFATAGGRPSRSGNPILFPFAGRIIDAHYRYGGRDYTITTAGENGANAIHGFVFNRPWRVTGRAADSVSGAFQGLIDAPETLNDWPGDYRIDVTYRVAGSSLLIDVILANPGATPLPYTFGLHPYFRLPLGGPSADDCLVTVPAERYWPLAEMRPAGEERPVDPARDLRTARRFGDLALDDVLTGLVAGDDGAIVTAIDDPASGVRLTQTFSTEHHFCIVYTPAHREAIAIEPYTGAPDPFRTADLGLEPRLAVLEPGGRWEASYRIALDTI